jgi:hypothetical protein
MSSQEYIRSVTEIVPDDFPKLTPLPDVSAATSSTNNNSFMSFFTNITWQTWIIIILILALLGINVFAYLAKGTQETAAIIDQVFGPILKFFGYTTLSTAKQTVETSATGTKAGVDIVAGAATDAIDTIQETSLKNGGQMQSSGQMQTNNAPVATSGTSTGVSYPQGQMAASSLPVQNKIQEAGSNIDQWQEDTLVKALDNAKQTADQVSPDDSRSSIQTTGKSGWCFIGEEQGIRTCSEIGVNDVCMSGDVFPNQAICMNPKLRA